MFPLSFRCCLIVHFLKFNWNLVWQVFQNIIRKFPQISKVLKIKRTDITWHNIKRAPTYSSYQDMSYFLKSPYKNVWCNHDLVQRAFVKTHILSFCILYLKYSPSVCMTIMKIKMYDIEHIYKNVNIRWCPPAQKVLFFF